MWSDLLWSELSIGVITIAVLLSMSVLSSWLLPDERPRSTPKRPCSRRSLPDSGTLEGDLNAVAVGLARGLSDSEWSAILPSFIDAAERDPELASLHRQFATNRHDVLSQILERARSRGAIRHDVSNEDILELIAGPLFYRRLITGEPISASKAKTLVRTIVRLATPDG